MKILHILDHSLPLHSGYTFRSQNIFEHQKKSGFSTIILTSSKHEESLGYGHKPCEIIDGVNYYRSGSVSGASLPFISELKLMRRLYKRILFVAGEEKPDLIHAHSPVLNAIPSIWASRKLGIPLVYEIRAFWEDAAVDHGTYAENSFKYNLVRRIETYVCKKADHVCVLCRGLQSDLQERGIDTGKITPVYNGINPDHIKPVEPDCEFKKEWNPGNRIIIGFVGSFYRYEGLDLLVSSFARLAEKNDNIMLLLVGGGETEKELGTIAEKAGIKDRVIMPGRIDHSKIAGVYSLIDILVYPRYSMRLTELVTPLKPLEAMAMKKAFVASDVGGHKELIIDGETGLLFRAGYEDGLVEKLEMLINSPEKRGALADKGYNWVRANHTWEKTTSVYKDIYSDLKNERMKR
ncbi:MAG: glycosyltransferase, exosortase A system-associated [Deltaproteobacteria bacterium]|nr:MAG: glycosyltransferase, exosortase A system-associated [Deltaproteobacteria bacterium]